MNFSQKVSIFALFSWEFSQNEAKWGQSEAKWGQSEVRVGHSGVRVGHSGVRVATVGLQWGHSAGMVPGPVPRGGTRDRTMSGTTTTPGTHHRPTSTAGTNTRTDAHGQ